MTDPQRENNCEMKSSLTDIAKQATVIVVFAVCIAISAQMLLKLFFSSDIKVPGIHSEQETEMMEQFNSIVSDSIEGAKASLYKMPKRYWLNEDTTIPPVPNPGNYGQTNDPKSLMPILESAQNLLHGQQTVFSPNTQIMEDSEITYYLDESILGITWKQVFDNFVYTISEVKISDPSQLRRYIAGESYGSNELIVTSKMAESVNAVVASSGDFYMGRKHGISVYGGTVYKANHGKIIDTCFIDKNGDLLFQYRGELNDLASVQEYVDDNDISFSLSFGPILVDDFKRCEPDDYALGEVNRGYPRAALCQVDELHYLIVAANLQGMYQTYPTIHKFASWIETLGCEKAYALDGGQTAVIVMNNQVINKVQFNFERKISDIFYFATACPEQ